MSLTFVHKIWKFIASQVHHKECPELSSFQIPTFLSYYILRKMATEFIKLMNFMNCKFKIYKIIKFSIFDFILKSYITYYLLYFILYYYPLELIKRLLVHVV
jgi:hypothetical protein